MLYAYLGNSSRSEQFVREFLDRRHTCWQLQRKRVEEMQNESRAANSASSTTKAASASSSASLSSRKQNHQRGDSSVISNGVHGNKAYTEPSDLQADSPVSAPFVL